MPTLEWDFRHTPYYRICSHIGTQKRGFLLVNPCSEVVGKPCHRRNLQKPTCVYSSTPYLKYIRYVYAEYTHEHLLILHSNDILKFPTFQNIELQALVNAFLYVVIKTK